MAKVKTAPRKSARSAASEAISKRKDAPVTRVQPAAQPEVGRAIFKARLELGEESVPVKLYSAVTDHTIHFKMVDKKSKQPVSAQMVDTESGDVVPYDQTLRGFKEGDSYIVLRAEELKRLLPKATREIETVALIGAGVWSSVWMDKPYYLGPDGDEEGYAAAAQALHAVKKYAVVHFVMRGHGYAGIVRSDGTTLVLITLRHRGEVVAPGALPRPSGPEPSARESGLAEQLVYAFDGVFDASSFADDYRDKVSKLIEAKAGGRAPRLQAPRDKPATDTLSDALARSLASMGKPSPKKAPNTRTR